MIVFHTDLFNSLRFGVLDLLTADLMLLFGRRIASQLSQLRNYVTQLLLSIHDEATGLINDANENLIRDDFNIHKIMVVVTVVGKVSTIRYVIRESWQVIICLIIPFFVICKVFGIDNLSGKVIWQCFVPNLEPFDRYGKQQLLLFVQRTTTHYPHFPQCVILGQNKVSKATL